MVAVPKKRVRLRFKHQVMMIMLLILGAAFLPVAIVLVVGIIPSMVSLMTDPTRDKTRSLTVALLNFVAVYPFVLNVAIDTPTMDDAIAVISQPLNICIMYAGAAAGYFLDWTLAGISNVIMTSRAKQRQEAIKKIQTEMVRRWGKEVTGSLPLDPDGFPIEEGDAQEGAK